MIPLRNLNSRDSLSIIPSFELLLIPEPSLDLVSCKFHAAHGLYAPQSTQLTCELDKNIILPTLFLPPYHQALHASVLSFHLLSNLIVQAVVLNFTVQVHAFTHAFKFDHLRQLSGFISSFSLNLSLFSLRQLP